MNRQSTLALAAAAALWLSTPLAQAQGGPMNFEGDFSKVVTYDACDENKDGTVTKAEFLSVMSKMWDARAKKMGAKSSERLSRAEFNQIMQYLRAGG